MNIYRRLLASLPALGLLALGGCATIGPNPIPPNNPKYAAVMPVAPKTASQNNGSLYQPQQDTSLFVDPKAHRVGDLLTVVLNESTSATKSADTTTSKKTGVSVATPSLLGQTLPKLGASLSSGNSFSGKGQSSQSNTVSGTITVTVAKVLSNGNLVVQGQNWITINQGREYVRLRGIVDPANITPQNTVLSTQIADAHIGYFGTGQLNSANRQGWLARFFNAWWPF